MKKPKKTVGKGKDIKTPNKVRIPIQKRAMDKKESIILTAYALFKKNVFMRSASG